MSLSSIYKISKENKVGIQGIISNAHFCSEKHFKTKDLLIEGELNLQRKLSNWQDNGILPRGHDYHVKKEFTFLEVVWIYIVTDLRKLGYSQSLIQKVMFQLFEQMTVADLLDSMSELYDKTEKISREEFDQLDEHGQSESSVGFIKSAIDNYNPMTLSVVVADCLYSRDRVYLSFSQKGSVRPFKIENLMDGESVELGLLEEACIVIPIHDIISRIVKNMPIKYVLPKLPILTKDELYIIEQIRNDKVQNINIEFDASNEIKIIRSREPGGMTRLEQELLEAVLTKGAYEQITVEGEDGKVAKFVRTTKRQKSKE